MRLRATPASAGRRAAAALALAMLGLAAVATPARAELVFFTTGRTLSVREHHPEGETVVLSLRGGGEMVVEPSLIAHFAPDEVPYPEPEPEALPDERSVVDATPVDSTTTDPRFDAIIRRVAAARGVDPTLVRAVIQVESAYEPRARSSKGALGLMQVMPATGRQYGITNLYDPSANIEAGVTHLRALLDRFPLTLALAAYNAGEAAVERFAGVPPYPETLDYVARIRRLVGQ